MALHPGSAVVVLGSGVPPAAVPLLRGAVWVYACDSVPPAVASSCGALPLPSPDVLAAQAASSPVVVLTTLDRDPVLPGAPVIGSAGLLAAVAVMDRLRSPGGCPWDAEQTHTSLRKYLLEETYELLDAIDSGDRASLREELGDVLLQVLFHARVAADADTEPFTIDDVAADLAAKLVRRHPHVFATDDAVHDAASQERRWEELKAAEKQRTSIVDGVALGQPALSLVAALVRRASRAGVPLAGVSRDEVPLAGVPLAGVPTAGVPTAGVPLDGGGSWLGGRLFALAAAAAADGEDPELALREVALRFAAQLREAGSG